MALKDLKSDLTKAFNRKPAGGKLEKMLENPNSSQLNYDSKPKPYKIPNDGRGAQVRYDQQSESYKTQSRLGEIQNTGNISGRFNTSDVEPVKSELGGRHENVDITLNELAKTPAKTAVEPIAMSATPVKQGVTPNLMKPTATKVGIVPEKIAITGYVDNQPPNLETSQYSLDIGEGALADLGGASQFDIDKLAEPYHSPGGFTTRYFTTRNGISVISPSERDMENDPKPYAESGYNINRMSHFFLGEESVFDSIDLDQEIGTSKGQQATRQFVTPNPTIQIHGSNINTPYDLDLETVLDSDSLYDSTDVKPAYADTDGLRFFTDQAKVIENANGDLESTMTLGQTDFFANQAKTNNPDDDGMTFEFSIGEIGHDVTGPKSLMGNGIGTGTWNLYSQAAGVPSPGVTLMYNTTFHGANWFSPLSNDDHRAVTIGDSTTWGFAPTNQFGKNNRNAIGYDDTNLGAGFKSMFRFLDFDAMNTSDLMPKGRIMPDAAGNMVFRIFDESQNFFNQDNPIISNGFAPQFNGKQLVLTGPWWDWTLGNIELSEYDWIQNDDDNPSIFSIAQNDPAVNYFDVNNDYYMGYINYNNLAGYFAMTGGWNNWQHSDTVVSRYTGINGSSYDNPSIYFETNASTNYFDQMAKYTSQFTRNVLAGNAAFGDTNYVNVFDVDANYEPLEIDASNSDYTYSTLFNTQLTYWKSVALYSGLNRFEHEDGITSLGHVIHGPGENYSPTLGLHPNPAMTVDNSFSQYLDESVGEYKHSMDDENQWPYYPMIGSENSNWGNGIGSFSAMAGGTPSSTPGIYQYLSNGMDSWIYTNTKLGNDEIESVEDNLVYFHPGYKPEADISTYGYGLGLTSHLKWYHNGTTAGSGMYTKAIAWRNPIGKRHITYLEGDQMNLIKDDSNWYKEAGYEWGPTMYGTKKGVSSGGIGGFSLGGTASGDLWLQAFSIDDQIFEATAPGLDSMGGIPYEERMINTYLTSAYIGKSTVGSVLNNLNPFDNIANIAKNMNAGFNDSIKRWWMQHNRFAIQMSNNPPKGSHQGLPGDSATGAIGRFGGMLNSVSEGGADLISTITGLSARKYWSVQSYIGLQISSEIIDTGITRFNDFRMFISDPGAVHVGLSGAANYLNNNIHKRYGYPSSGTPGIDRKTYYKHIPGMGDDITMEDVWIGEQEDTENHKADFIAFKLKDVVNNEYWRFRAYISGLTDSVSANWGQYNYVGRPDPVFQYNGATARTLSFNLKVAALAQQDMYWMWKKINKLMGMNYPASYEKGQFMTGPMMELTLGQYVHEAPCFMNAFTLTVPDDSPWEINQMRGSPGPFGDLASSVSTVTNVLNDPLGSAVNFGASFATKQEDYPAARKNNKNYAFNEFSKDAYETQGTLLAQLPHIVDLSLGFTIIGNQDKRVKGLHFGDPSAEFFKGWDTSAEHDKPGAKGKGEKIMDFLGL